MDNGVAATITPSPTPAAVSAAPTLNAEPAALFWLAWGGLWTVLVLGGMAFLFVNRKMPFLRIRGLALSFGAVTMLHLYWISVQIGLAIGSYVPDGAEFWVMGLYLPFGIALFHASNSRFLHVAKAQRRYAGTSGVLPQPEQKPCDGKDKTLVGRFQKLDYTTKMLAVVSTGMLLQVRNGTSSGPCLVRFGKHMADMSFSSAASHCRDVARLPQVPSLVWHPRYRGQGHRGRAEGREGKRLGMVAFGLLAVPMGLDRRALHPLEITWHQ